ncbi:MAG: hypothetical protein PVG07_01035 [Acidobacteriota bacterium]|jgi:hypothetical protein
MKRVSNDRFTRFLIPDAIAWMVLLTLTLLCGACHGSASADSESTALLREEENALRVHGVNYDPAAPAHSLSWTPLKLEMSMRLAGRSLDLAADYGSWIAGAVLQAPLQTPAAIAAGCTVSADSEGLRTAECPISLIRLAQWGVTEGEAPMEWLLEAEREEEGSAGRVRVELDENGAPRFPADVVLSPHLVFTLRRAGDDRPIRLRSRTRLVLEGRLDAWPQGLMVLRSTGDAVPLKAEGAAGVGAEGLGEVEVKDVTMAFADKPSEFFRQRPRILSATPLDPEGEPWTTGRVTGVALKWADTAAQTRSSRITHYRIYRNRDPDGDGAWRLAGVVEASETRFVDRTFDGDGPVEYVVSHEMDFPFGYRYEGVFYEPMRIQEVGL